MVEYLKSRAADLGHKTLDMHRQGGVRGWAKAARKATFSGASTPLRACWTQSVEAPLDFSLNQIVEVYPVVVVSRETLGGADEEVYVTRVVSVGLSERLNLVAKLPEEVVGIRDGDDLASAMIDDS